MTRTRMVLAASVLAGAMGQFSCDESPPVDYRASTPALAPRPAREPVVVVPGLPKPIQLAKPPVLGPTAPALVLLPEHMAEPEIRIRLTDEQDRPPAIVAGKYRGRIQSLRMPSGKYVAVNFVPLDSYLQGVLAGEILDKWDAETFRAQAIAARTFALFQMSTDGRGKQWDVNADTSSQMYGGISKETAKSRSAVIATHGQVLTATLNGKTGIFCSFYSSCIGGASQDPFDAWGDPSIMPLAAHVTGNVDENSTRYKWDRDFVVSKADVSRCIQSWGTRNDFDYLKVLGKIESVVISKRNPSTNRPTEITLTDAAGKTAPIRAEEFRLR